MCSSPRKPIIIFTMLVNFHVWSPPACEINESPTGMPKSWQHFVTHCDWLAVGEVHFRIQKKAYMLYL